MENRKIIYGLLQKGILEEKEAQALRGLVIKNDDLLNAFVSIQHAAEDLNKCDLYAGSDLAFIIKKFSHLND